MVKRYFITNTLSTDLPLDFINATKEKRHIHVLNVKLMETSSGKLLMDVSVHGDFIIDNPDRNGFICFCNEQLAKRKKWQIFHQPRKINLHFEDLDGVTINPSTIKFTAEFMLEFDP